MNLLGGVWLIVLGIIIGINVKIGIVLGVLALIVIFKKTKLFIYLVLLSFTINYTFYFLKVNVVYSDVILLIFTAYYILFELDNLKSLFVNNTLIALISLFFFVVVASQFQSFYIDFPITTIRSGAILNYPLIKGLTRITQVFILFLFTLCVAHYARRISLKELLNIHLNVTTAISFAVIFIFLSDIILPGSYLVHLTSTKSQDIVLRMKWFFSEPAILALYLMTSFSILASLLFNSFNKWRLLYFFAQLIAIILTFSRAGWIALFVVLVMLSGFYLKRYLEIYSRQTVLTVIFILLLVSGVFLAHPRVNNFFQKYAFQQFLDAVNPSTGKFWSTRFRLEAYSYAIDAFRMHPLLGVGVFNFHFYGGVKLYNDVAPGMYLNFSETNNVLLTVLSELGLIGLTFFLFAATVFLNYFVRNYKFNKDVNVNVALLIGFFVSIFAILSILLFASKFTYGFLWFFAGLFIAFLSQNRVTDSRLTLE